MTAAAPTAIWTRRPLVGGLLRLAAAALPLAAGIAVGLVVADITRPPATWQEALARGCAALAASTVVAIAAERLARRLLPLILLYELSLRFPGDAPQRVRVALHVASSARLRATVQAALDEGSHDVARSAERITALAAALQAHDPRTRQHSERVRAISEVLGAAMGLDDERLEALRWGALLHDVGKLAVAPQVLEKPGALDHHEWSIMRRHPSEGARMVSGLDSWLGTGLTPVSQHHERWDGTGYPAGLAGTEIALEARIVAVADAFEVMTATRAYKEPFDADSARAELVALAGTQFDPAVVRAMVTLDLDDLSAVSLPLLWLAELPLFRWVPGFSPSQFAAGSLAVVAGAVSGGVLPSLAPPTGAAATLPSPPQAVAQLVTDDVPSWSVASIDLDGGDVRAEPGRAAWGSDGSMVAQWEAAPSEGTEVAPAGPISRPRATPPPAEPAPAAAPAPAPSPTPAVARTSSSASSPAPRRTEPASRTQPSDPAAAPARTARPARSQPASASPSRTSQPARTPDPVPSSPPAQAAGSFDAPIPQGAAAADRTATGDAYVAEPPVAALPTRTPAPARPSTPASTPDPAPIPATPEPAPAPAPVAPPTTSPPSAPSDGAAPPPTDAPGGRSDHAPGRSDNPPPGQGGTPPGQIGRDDPAAEAREG